MPRQNRALVVKTSFSPLSASVTHKSSVPSGIPETLKPLYLRGSMGSPDGPDLGVIYHGDI